MSPLARAAWSDVLAVLADVGGVALLAALLLSLFLLAEVLR